MFLSALLTALFVGLKLTNVIAWSWVWVLAPAWIGVVLWLICLVALAAISVWANKEYRR